MRSSPIRIGAATFQSLPNRQDNNDSLLHAPDGPNPRIRPMSDKALLPELTRLCDDALAALAPVHQAAETAMRGIVTVDGKIDASALDENQYASHGFAWFSTYVTALKQMKAWSERLEIQGKFGTLEQLILQAAFGEYLAQLQGGITMSQGEF